MRERRTTAVYVSHDLAVVAQMADHILVLRDGKMRELGAEAKGNTPDGTRALLAAEIVKWKKVISKDTGEFQIVDGVVDRDECNRADTTLQSLAGLAPAFEKGGTVTAGNASQLSDGASMTLLMSEKRAQQLGLTPLAYFRGWAVAGCHPDEMGIGPVFAVPRLLKRHGLSVDDIGVWELNEAFAVQVLYCRDKLGIDPEKLNVNGGAIALGHPIGASGARVLTTLLFEMQKRDAKKGLATLCIGGGMGIAMCLARD